MKLKFEVEADGYEERDEIQIYAHAVDYKLALDEIREQVRQRLKYGENISDEEERVLEEIRYLTHIEVD